MFVVAYGENFTIEQENQTINITIYPQINIESPTNNITLESQNLTKIEEILQTIQNEPSWSEGDIIVASSTIFAFFTFGSFLIIRFQGKSKNEQLEDMKTVLITVAGIQVIHVVVILAIVLGVFSVNSFALVLIATIMLILIILRLIIRILNFANNEEERNELINEYIKPLTVELNHEIRRRLDAEQLTDDATRELNKLVREQGEY